MNENFENQAREAQMLSLINAATYLDHEPPEPDQILTDTLDIGDKMTIIAPSKLRKSFFTQQLALSLAVGRDFLKWEVPKARRVLYCQFEIQDKHMHRRIRNLARAMNLKSEDIKDNLMIINGRGLGLIGPDGVKRVQEAAAAFNPEVIVFDPLYKIAGGVENTAEDMKTILNSFDCLAEQTGAAIIYVHHDPKGSPGERDLRDRGSGSNVLGRDYDAAVMMTQHASEDDAAVVETILRNYRPQEPFSAIWEAEEGRGYCFRVDYDITPEKKTAKNKIPKLPSPAYAPAAAQILGDSEMDIGPFKTAFKEATGLSDKRIRDFMHWAVAGGNPFMKSDFESWRGHFRKWVWLNKKN
jgi:hypothetical protein